MTYTDELKEATVITVDTETSSLHPWRDGGILAGIAFKPLGKPAFYLPFFHGDDSAPGKHGTDPRNLPKTILHECMEALKGKTLIFHNAKYDLAVLNQEGYDLHNENVLDTMVLMRLVSENEPNYELKNLASKYIDKNAKKHEAKLKAYMKKNKLDFYSQVPIPIIEPYAIKDVEFTEWLYEYAMPLIDERDLHQLLALEQNVTRCLFEVEARGIMIDKQFVSDRLDVLEPDYIKAEKDCYDLAIKLLSERFNNPNDLDDSELTKLEIAMRLIQDSDGMFKLHGPHDLRKVFHALGIYSNVKTKKGGESWSKDAFKVITKEHPNPIARKLATAISVYRALHRIVEQYYYKFNSLMDDSGALHPSLMQSGTRTGRLSCREPNLQNIPKEETFDFLEYSEDDEDLAEVRDAFVPRKNSYFLMADWSQIELRLLADYADEKVWKMAFHYGVDIHKITARAAFGPAPTGEAAAKKWRANGKNLNFALVYGLGNKNLGVRIGVTSKKANAFKEKFFKSYPNVRKFIDLAKNTCMDRMLRVCKIHTNPTCQTCDGWTYKGWGKNKFGRRRYLEQDKAYILVNFIIQGGNADLLKMCFCGIHWNLIDLWSSVVNLVHDEIITEVAYSESEKVIPIIVSGMQDQNKFDIPIRVDLKWAPDRWGQAKKLECKNCDGIGTVYPYTETQITELLFNHQWDELEKMKGITCNNCKGLGYETSEIYDHWKERTQQIQKELVTV